MCVYSHIFTTSQPKRPLLALSRPSDRFGNSPTTGRLSPLLISPQQPDQTATWQLRLQAIYRASTGVVHETVAARSDPVA